jgi:hypothetical protein
MNYWYPPVSSEQLCRFSLLARFGIMIDERAQILHIGDHDF